MNRKGPLITLLAGFGLAAVLVALSINAASKDAAERANRDTGALQPPPTKTPPAAAEPTPSASPTPPAAPVKVAYTGRVNGGGATVAVAVNGDKAVAYLCNGRNVESWLQGTATGGQLTLTGAGGASLRGSFGNGSANGTVTVQGKRWSFIALPARAPGGLYRTATALSNAKVVGGWIVLADGTQVGILSTNNKPAPAPRLDTSNGTASVNGKTVTARLLDGSGL